jgi:hypothetical protein
MGKYALVEYEKITRLTMPIDEENLLLVTADSTKSPMKIIDTILSIISNPKLYSDLGQLEQIVTI